MQKLIIRNGTIVTTEGKFREDLVIEDGKIVSRGITDPAEHRGIKVIDAKDKLVFPGGIDPHVHMALPTPAGPSSDDFLTGSLAAIAGGTTCIIDFVTPRRGQSLVEALHQRRAEASDCRTGYLLHMGISEWNPKVADEVLECMEKHGIRSFKAYLAYRDTIGITENDLEELMKVVGPSGGTVLVHCEDGEMISRLQKEFLHEGKTRPFYHAFSHPPEAEIKAVEKVIELSQKTGCPVYIVHTSTGQAAEKIRQAKKSGLKVYGETCPQYLLLNDSVYDEKKDDLDVLPYVISPPLRASSDQEALWKGLSDGTFDTLATDHCPFNLHGQKDRGINDFTKIPNGAGGIEHRLVLLYTFGVLTGKISINQFVDLVSTRPAEIFGLATHKGKLDTGYDADVVIWDPAWTVIISAKNHHQHCDSDIYEGFAVRGRPETVILDGEIVIRNGKLL